MKNSLKYCFITFLIATLAACGSSGSNDDNDTSDPAGGGIIDDGGDNGGGDDNTETLFSTRFVLTSIPDYTPEDATVFIAGTLNGWKPNDPASQLQLNANGQYEVTFDLPAGPVLYKFTRGGWDSVEKDATGLEVADRQLVVSADSTIEITIGNWADFVSEVGESTKADNVEVIESITMPELNRERRVWVYLPPDYASSSKDYPVLYMHDGQNVFDGLTSFSGEWEVDETLNALFATGESNGVIVVAVDNSADDRYEEYSPWPIANINGVTRGGDGALYAAFLVNTLKPYIDANYRTLPDRDNTAIAGSSMGGLISLYTGLSHQETFSKIGAFSPYISESRIGTAVFDFIDATAITESMKIHLDIGEFEDVRGETAELIDAVETVYNKLIAKNLPAESVRYQLIPNAHHNEAAWSARFGDVATWLLGKGAPDIVILDTDADGINDDIENQYAFLDPNDPTDADMDFDNDGISNIDELELGSAPDNPDSDFDQLPDGYELENDLNVLLAGDDALDSDNDGLDNLTEFNGGTSPILADSDMDGANDAEDAYPLDPTKQTDEPAMQLTITLFSLPDNTPDDADIYMVGDFNAWEPADDNYKLTKQNTGAYSISFAEFPEGPIKFKFTRGAWTNVEKDIAGNEIIDREITVDGSSQVGAYIIESWADLPFKATHSRAGNIVIHENMDMPQLNKTRTIRVYLPPNHDTSDERFPVLYMYDGQNLFDKYTTAFGTEWKVDETLEQLYYEGKITGLIVVGIDNSFERGCEYNPFDNDIHPACGNGTALGDDFNAFIVDTLKPFIDSTYQTLTDRDNTFIGGASMGGQMAMKMGLDYQTVFSKIAAVSPSYQNELDQPFNMPTHVANTGKQQDMKIYQDMGTLEQVRDIDAAKLISNMNAVHTALLDADFGEANLVKVTDDGAEHNEAAWAKRFPSIVEWLMQ